MTGLAGASVLSWTPSTGRALSLCRHYHRTVSCLQLWDTELTPRRSTVPVGQGWGKLALQLCLPTMTPDPKLSNVNKKAPTLKADSDHQPSKEGLQGMQCKVRQEKGSRATLCDAEPQPSWTGQAKGEPYLPRCSLR